MLGGAVAGLAAFAAAWAYGAPEEAWRLGVVAACLAGVLVFDARYLVIPDLYVLLLVMVAASGVGRLGWLHAGLGAALGGGLLLGVRALFLRYRGVEGLGLGDVKLMAALGGLVGPEHLLWIIIAAAVLGAVWIGLRRNADGGGSVVAPFGAAAVPGPGRLRADPAKLMNLAGRYRAGFSLIEALVALIIAAMALSAALVLQQQLADGQRRYQQALTTAALERDAMALTADLNPTAQPTGEAALAGGSSVRWAATPRSAPMLNAGSARAGRRFELRLYRVVVQVVDNHNAVVGQLNFDRVGWRKLDRPAPFIAPPPPPAPPVQPPPQPPLSPKDQL